MTPLSVMSTQSSLFDSIHHDGSGDARREEVFPRERLAEWRACAHAGERTPSPTWESVAMALPLARWRMIF